MGIVSDRKESLLWSTTCANPGNARIFAQNIPDHEECPWHEAAVVIDVFVVLHLVTLGSVCENWCKRRCVQEALVVNWRLPCRGE